MADPVVAEYARAAEHYDEKWAFYVETTTRETLRRMPMTATARVLDVGCGTGELERYKISWLWGLMTAVVSL